MRQKVALVGPGRVGCAVAKHLHQAGYELSAVIGRTSETALDACTFIGCSEKAASLDIATVGEARIILIAVPDDYISSLSEQIHAQLKEPQDVTLVHFSGLHPAVIMRQHSPGARVLSLHPLLPFADRQSAYEQLPNCPCAVEGDDTARSLGEELVQALGAQYFHLEGDKKALYHAAACIASNFCVTLMAWACELLQNCDIDNTRAVELLAPLLQATLKNVTALGPEQGLTGPIVRGDSGTVSRHLDELKKISPQQQAVYRDLAKLTLSLAEKSGRLDSRGRQQLHRVLSRAT
ncbi:MAG: DUF2520 domain-containing protein [Desulfuromonadales bacterium]|nr:DUF2520 domain-containing protein [Desulfuromonadales bacterium]MBN2792006.1 DUF2520 domain-containing protein [Desulfuromonadales bacterium]